MDSEAFSGMKGVRWEVFKELAEAGRWGGELQLRRHGDRWALLVVPRGEHKGDTYYLIGEKSGRARLFAKADTALSLARTIWIERGFSRSVRSGLWVNFKDLVGSGLSVA